MEFLDTAFLESDEIKLVLERTAEADPIKRWVPADHFFICNNISVFVTFDNICKDFCRRMYTDCHKNAVNVKVRDFILFNILNS